MKNDLKMLEYELKAIEDEFYFRHICDLQIQIYNGINNSISSDLILTD